MSRKTIVVALGGNAIIEEGTEGTIAQQFENTRKSMDAIVGLIREGHRVVLSHGNGPQAGIHLIRNEAASSQVPPAPLNVIVADTQGSMGYMIAQCLSNALIKAKIEKDVVTVVTQVVVDPQDPSMSNPTKYVGPFYKAEQVDKLRSRGWIIKEDPGRGFRRRRLRCSNLRRWSLRCGGLRRRGLRCRRLGGGGFRRGHLGRRSLGRGGLGRRGLNCRSLGGDDFRRALQHRAHHERLHLGHDGGGHAQLGKTRLLRLLPATAFALALFWTGNRFLAKCPACAHKILPDTTVCAKTVITMSDFRRACKHYIE